MDRQIKFYEAVREALDLSMARDKNVYVMGLGATDPKGVFGTTLGLEKKYGSDRVLDMPTSENGMTGVAIGSALMGMRPVMTHQRVDFMLLAMDQIVNNAAKWHYMYGGKMCVPLVIRLVIGRGWGQGAQHSQSLQAWFAHVPGLKVVMPGTPHDAKGLLISSIEDNNPVIFLEHRWLHNTFGHVPAGHYRVPLCKARVARVGTDVTIVATSHMVIEALNAAEALTQVGVETEIVDVRTLQPLDKTTILESVAKTGRLVVLDTGWKFCGFGAEVVAVVSEQAHDRLKLAPRRLGLADIPIPTSQALSVHCYPRSRDVVQNVCELMNIQGIPAQLSREDLSIPADVPDAHFTGPF